MEIKHSLEQLEEGVHMTRQAQISHLRISHPQRSKKRYRLEPPTHKKQAHASSVHRVKKRIRDVKRRLDGCPNLPANVRVEDERALGVYEQELNAALEEKTRQKMIKRYHMVRFFERQKATRQLKKLRKLLLEAKSTDEVENIKARVHIAEVDLNYTQYFPLNERYVGLYAIKEDTNLSLSQVEEIRAKKPALWDVVEKSMEDGTLDKLRNRKKGAVAGLKSRNVQSTLKTSAVVLDQSSANIETDKLRSEADTSGSATEGMEASKVGILSNDIQFATSRATAEDDEDSESDLGFFEE